MRLNMIIVILLALSSCRNESQSSATAETDPGFNLVEKSFRKDINCKNLTTSCYVVTIDYLRSNSSDSLSTTINEYLLDYLDDFLASEIVVEDDDIDLYIKNMVEANAKSYKEEDGTFEIDIDMESYLQNDNITCIRLSYYQYAGGAHGNAGVGYHIFDNASARLLTNSDIIDNDVAFKELVLQAIKDSAEEDLEDLGYFISDEEFEINDNIGVSADSLFISYVPYEIAPYVAGFTNVAFSRQEVKDMLLPSFVENWSTSE